MAAWADARPPSCKRLADRVALDTTRAAFVCPDLGVKVIGGQFRAEGRDVVGIDIEFDHAPWMFSGKAPDIRQMLIPQPAPTIGYGVA